MPVAQWFQNQLAGLEIGVRAREALEALEKETKTSNIPEVLKKIMALLVQMCTLKEKEDSLKSTAERGGEDVEAEDAPPFVAVYRLEASTKCLNLLHMETFGDLVAKQAKQRHEALAKLREELSEAAGECYRGGSMDWQQRVQDSECQSVQEVIKQAEETIVPLDAAALKEATQKLQKD